MLELIKDKAYYKMLMILEGKIKEANKKCAFKKSVRYIRMQKMLINKYYNEEA